MEIKRKTYNLYIEYYPEMYDVTYWDEQKIECPCSYKLYLNYSDFIQLYLDKEGICASMNYKYEEHFPLSYGGFRVACEWLDDQRIKTIETYAESLL